jgi:hypothetical protein
MRNSPPPTRPSIRYPKLGEYMGIHEYERGVGSPQKRFQNLSETLVKNGVRKDVSASIRSADRDSKFEQEGFLLDVAKFDVDRAIEGFLDRISQALENGADHIETEEKIANYPEVIEELGRAVSEKVQRRLRIIPRAYEGAGKLHFVEKFRIKSRLETSLGERSGRVLSKVIQFFTGKEAVTENAKSLLETCFTEGMFLRDYFNEWQGFKWLISSEEAWKKVAKKQVEANGVVIRSVEEYFPKDVHRFAITDKNRRQVETLNSLAHQLNTLYIQKELTKEKFAELIAQAERVCI